MLHLLLTVIVCCLICCCFLLFVFLFCFILFGYVFCFFFVQIAAIINMLFALNPKKQPITLVITFHFVLSGWTTLEWNRKAKIELNGIEWNKYIAPELQIHFVVQQKSLSKTHNYG